MNLSTCRIILWSCAALLAHLGYRRLHPVAWKLALFAGLFGLLWQLVSKSPRRKKGTGEEDAFTPTEETLQPRSPFPAVLVDMGVTVSLIATTGGFRSPFLPLLLFPVLESRTLFGTVSAIKMAIAVGLLTLVNFRGAATVANGILYTVTLGVLALTGVLSGRRPSGASDADSETPELGFLGRRNALRSLETTIQALEAEREQAIADRQQVRETYSEVARLHREQKVQIARLEMGSQLLSIHLSTEASDGGDRNALSAMLTILLDSFEARSGAIWMREAGGERLTPCVAEGNHFDTAKMPPIEKPLEMFPSDLRIALETQLIAQAPASAFGGYGDKFGNRANPQAFVQGMVPYPAIVALVRTHDGEGILGAVGLCDARGASRFNDSDYERLQEAASPLSQTFRAIEERNALRRRNAELTALYDLSRLFQTATSLEQVNLVAVHKAQSVLNGADTALYHFDREAQKMVLQTSRGTAVNLLDFAKFGSPNGSPNGNFSGKIDTGLKGWFNTGAKQVSLPDLTDETALVLSPNLPVNQGSFAATPVVVGRRLVGMLTHYSPQPHAFDAPDLKTMERIAEQLGTALERTETYSTLEQIAMSDPETGLANARYFRYRFAEEFNRVQQYGTEATVVIFALDRRETLVSRHGVAVVGGLLKTVAQCLENIVPELCLPARYDESRLALLLPHTDFARAGEIFDALRASLEVEEIRTGNGKILSLSLSAGIASLILHGTTPEETLHYAETALAEAHSLGGDRFQIAETFVQIAALSSATFEVLGVGH